ncbi:MAG TPA: Imm17 family immunity protein [Bacillota bacterium]|jgi:hypothetical protein|nr:Imm17 family immunity protein [Bacillota bacterium]HOL10969.1 Imm17 family immunity protein [Bacillota bacterium]HPO97382.1 Imm17 family immunity protein [Bacillota bacterium]
MALFAKILFLGMGIYMLLGSILKWDNLLKGRKEARLASLIGETGVRYFYGILGALLIVVGVMMFFGNYDFLFQ